jgi:hypothetical protein
MFISFGPYISLLIGMRYSQPHQIPLRRHLGAQLSTVPSQTSQRDVPPQPPTTSAVLLSCGNRVSQHRGVTLGSQPVPPISCSHACTSTGLQNTHCGQQESHNMTNESNQIVRNSEDARGSVGSSGQKIRSRRGRSPQCRGADKVALAVSSSPTSTFAMYSCAHCICRN